MAITHAFASTVVDNADTTIIGSDEWNAAHIGECSGTVPVGGIIIWSGTIATIPANWALCDGNNGTPNLTDRFIICAKQDDAGAAKTNVTGALTVSGGAATHDHDATSAAVSAHSLSTSVAIDAHSLTTDVAVSAHSLSTNVALSAHSLTTNVAIADHTLTTSAGRTSTASSRAFVTTTTLTHTITQPVIQAHSITQPVINAHSITQPVVAAHNITQPAFSNHSITQPTISVESNLPPYYALAYIQRTA